MGKSRCASVAVLEGGGGLDLIALLHNTEAQIREMVRRIRNTKKTIFS